MAQSVLCRFFQQNYFPNIKMHTQTAFFPQIQENITTDQICVLYVRLTRDFKIFTIIDTDNEDKSYNNNLLMMIHLSTVL